MAITRHMKTHGDLYSSFMSVVVTHTLTKDNLGEERVCFSPQFQIIVYCGGQGGRYLKQLVTSHPQSKAERDEFTHAYYAASSLYCIPSRMQNQVMVLPRVGWVFPHHLLKIMSPRHAHKPTCSRLSLTVILF